MTIATTVILIAILNWTMLLIFLLGLSYLTFLAFRALKKRA